ncbi:MAG: SGNH/GDSL hydrolase family protein [Anaerolineales bacterium]
MRLIALSLNSIIVAALCTGCLAAAASALDPVASASPAVAEAADSDLTNTPALSTVPPTDEDQATDEPAPENWQDYPVVPVLSATALEIYRQGLLEGNDPHNFSKIGDCQNITTYFLSAFENTELYSLGDYEELQDTIDWFAGSFSRESLAVAGGLNVARVLSPFHVNRELCEPNENSLTCEVRVHNPSVALVSLEENWSQRTAEEYEKHLRAIVETLISEGVLPILATKADNLEGDHSINAAIARVAAKYEVPLWNFWLAVQPLPSHGLQADGYHLTLAGSYFDDPVRMKTAWAWRNLTALQALDAVRTTAGE